MVFKNIKCQVLMIFRSFNPTCDKKGWPRFLTFKVIEGQSKIFYLKSCTCGSFNFHFQLCMVYGKKSTWLFQYYKSAISNICMCFIFILSLAIQGGRQHYILKTTVIDIIHDFAQTLLDFKNCFLSSSWELCRKGQLMTFNSEGQVVPWCQILL